MKSRFLLTFDDGPDATRASSTIRILDGLSANSVQQNVKAIFFVQTRAPNAGGSERGRAIMKREHAEGHVLGLHSGTMRGHVSHVWMSPGELDESLRDGVRDIWMITGQSPLLVRPPYWWFNPDTLTQYGQFGLHMMLSDLKAYDGVNWGMHIFRRPNLRTQLEAIREGLTHQALPVVGGCTPLVVTFHDTNSYTAGHLDEYLHILLEEARHAGVAVDEKPFYDGAADIISAALQRAVAPLQPDVNVRLSA
jgi:peptidoglycan/xylan/chitin deacetylase (PgdA/CDA1 family)